MMVELKWYGDKAIRNMEQAVNVALEVSALVVEGAAKNLAPVDTGNLRNSITHVIDSQGKAARVGTNVHYGPYVELGTSKMAAQPYLSPALDQNKGNIRKIFADAIKEAMDD